MDIEDVKLRLMRVSQGVTGEAKEIVNGSIPLLVLMNRNQMLEGKDSNGNNIRPSYLEDNYFKTKEAAQKYAEWKQRITPNPKRGFETPNLIINGAFHSSVKGVVMSDGIKFTTDSALGRNVILKFDTVLGIAPENRKKIIHEVLLPRLKKYVHESI